MTHSCEHTQCPLIVGFLGSLPNEVVGQIEAHHIPVFVILHDHIWRDQENQRGNLPFNCTPTNSPHLVSFVLKFFVDFVPRFLRQRLAHDIPHRLLCHSKFFGEDSPELFESHRFHILGNVLDSEGDFCSSASISTVVMVILKGFHLELLSIWTQNQARRAVLTSKANTTKDRLNRKQATHIWREVFFVVFQPFYSLFKVSPVVVSCEFKTWKIEFDILSVLFFSLSDLFRPFQSDLYIDFAVFSFLSSVFCW